MREHACKGLKILLDTLFLNSRAYPFQISFYCNPSLFLSSLIYPCIHSEIHSAEPEDG